MELRHLRYFVAVAEEAHVTRAALRIGIQQPPLSKQIRALEREVGTALFKRLPRGMALTPAGEAFLPEARAIISHSERSVVRARQAAAGQVGRVAVGLTTSASLHPLIPHVLSSFHRSSPAISLDVVEANAADLTEALTTNRIDVAFLRMPVSEPYGLLFEELLRERLLVVLSEGHPLTGQRIGLGHLRDSKLILVRRPSAPGLYAQILDSCRASGFEPTVVAEVARMLTAINLVAAGIGITVVPSSMAAMRVSGITYTPLAGPDTLAAPLTLVYREGSAHPAVTRLVRSVRNARNAFIDV